MDGKYRKQWRPGDHDEKIEQMYLESWWRKDERMD